MEEQKQQQQQDSQKQTTADAVVSDFWIGVREWLDLSRYFGLAWRFPAHEHVEVHMPALRQRLYQAYRHLLVWIQWASTPDEFRRNDFLTLGKQVVTLAKHAHQAVHDADEAAMHAINARIEESEVDTHVAAHVARRIRHRSTDTLCTTQERLVTVYIARVVDLLLVAMQASQNTEQHLLFGRLLWEFICRADTPTRDITAITIIEEHIRTRVIESMHTIDKLRGECNLAFCMICVYPQAFPIKKIIF